MRSLATGVDVEVLETDTRVMAASGHLLFQRVGQLWAQPFDEETGSVRGEAQRLADDVAWAGANGRAGFHVSESGVLVHRAGAGFASVTKLVWRARNGFELGTVGDSDYYVRAAVSPAGDRLITHIEANAQRGTIDAPSDLWMVDLARGVRARFTAEPGYKFGPLWSPDGSQVVYGISDRAGGEATLWMRGSGGATKPRQITMFNTGAPTSWSPDGRFVVANSTATALDVLLVPLSGERPAPLLNSQFAESNAVFSPDGTLLAYQSTEALSTDVYVQPWPFTGEKWRLSTGGGRQPQWNPRGGELFYVTLRNDLMAVTVTGSGRSRTFSAPMRLFGDAVYNPGSITRTAAYAPSPDGQRILTVVSTSTAASDQASPLLVTINWLSLLK